MDFSNINLDYDTIFPYALAGLLTILIMILGITVVYVIKKNTQTVNYDKQLQDLINDEDDYETAANTKISYFQKWNRYWGELAKGAGIVRYTRQEGKDLYKRAGRDVFVLMAFSAIVISLILQNVIFGLLIAIIVPFVCAFVMKHLISKKASALSQQLPGFIFALKAQIQASETNERAMLKVVDSMPSPLYEDLRIVKNRLLAASTFKEALEELSKKTTSPDLKFLAACMIQASSSGANLEEQLDSIQEVLESRRKVEDEINQAVQSATPAIWLSSLAIPGVFLASLILDSNSREFWLTQPIAWLVLACVAVLYGISMFMVRNQVQKIKDI